METCSVIVQCPSGWKIVHVVLVLPLCIYRIRTIKGSHPTSELVRRGPSSPSILSMLVFVSGRTLTATEAAMIYLATIVQGGDKQMLRPIFCANELFGHPIIGTQSSGIIN